MIDRVVTLVTYTIIDDMKISVMKYISIQIQALQLMRKFDLQSNLSTSKLLIKKSL